MLLWRGTHNAVGARQQSQTYCVFSAWCCPGLAGPPTMRSSKPSTVASGPNASTPVGSCPCGRPQEKVENWRRNYNEERPHGTIGNRPPILLQNHVDVIQPANVIPAAL